MLAAIKHGLGNLTNFHGRDARQAFWYYVLFVYIITIAISMVVTVPMMVRGFAIGVQQGIAASQSSDPLAAQIATQAAIARSMSDMMSTMLWVSIATNLLMLLFLAASFVRRLHDGGLSGYWALIPGAAQVANLILAPALMRGMAASMANMTPGDPTAGVRMMQGSFGFASILGVAVIVIVIVLGARQSTPGPNRYGESAFTA